MGTGRGKGCLSLEIRKFFMKPFLLTSICKYRHYIHADLRIGDFILRADKPLRSCEPNIHY